MKFIFLSLILAMFMVQVHAQNDSIVYYRRALQNETQDSARINIMNNLGWKYLFTKVDSSIYYGQEALKLSQQKNYTKGEITSYEILARAMRGIENYSEELRLAMLYLEKSEELKDTVTMFFGRREIMWCYRDMGDNNKAYEYALSLVQLLDATAIKRKKNGDRFGEMAYRFLGTVYDKLGKKDSALKYYSISHAIALKLADPESLALNTGTLADYHLEHNNIDSAFYYYRISLPYAEKAFRNDVINENYIGMASAFLKRGNEDSAISYARQALERLSSVPDTSGMNLAAKLISDIFKSKNNIDSAYKYLKYADTLSELLSEQEKIKKAKDLLFSQTLQNQQSQNERQQAEVQYENNKKIFLLISGLVIVLVIAFMFYRSSKRQQKDAIKIQQAYDQLKSAQAQLIQSEKMASLGELTAGIAHEIQNPLNFVNNFSEINNELIEELKSQKSELKTEQQDELLDDIFQNNEKINHHGKRADAIVKSMLQHSRQTKSAKEPTDINKLADEYLRLAYHGLRAKDKDFNAEIKTDFDANIGKINIIPQDIGRVLLNLFNNAFYAVNEKKKTADEKYKPLVTVATKSPSPLEKGWDEVIVSDNGNGIPQNIIDKIFQPFFTTKPTGSGTGLGLSLSYDIVKAHGGEIKVQSKEGKGTEFIIQLPTNNPS